MNDIDDLKQQYDKEKDKLIKELKEIDDYGDICDFMKYCRYFRVPENDYFQELYDVYEVCHDRLMNIEIEEDRVKIKKWIDKTALDHSLISKSNFVTITFSGKFIDEMTNLAAEKGLLMYITSENIITGKKLAYLTLKE